MLLFAPFDLSTPVTGHKPFLGHLPACKVALVLFLRLCRSAVKCSQLGDCCLSFFPLWGPHHSSSFAWTSWLLYKESAQCLPEQLCPLAASRNCFTQSRASSVYTLTCGDHTNTSLCWNILKQDAELSPDGGFVHMTKVLVEVLLAKDHRESSLLLGDCVFACICLCVWLLAR